MVSILPDIDTRRNPGLEELLLNGLAKRGLAPSTTLETLVKTYEDEGKLKEAWAILEQTAGEKRDAVEPLLELARVADRQGDDEGKLGYLAHARDLQPNNASVHFLFGIACVKLSLTQGAYVSLKKAVTFDPDNAYYNYAFGAVAVERDDPSESIPYFRRFCTLKAR